MSGSLVMAKMAGTESIAKTMSQNSIKIRQTIKGVTFHADPILRKNFPSSDLWVTGKTLCRNRRTGLVSGLMA